MTVILSGLTFSVLVSHQFVLDQLSQNLVAAPVFQAGDGRQQIHWDDLMVLQPHLNLQCITSMTEEYIK